MKKCIRILLISAVLLLSCAVFFGITVSAKSSELVPSSDSVIFIKDSDLYDGSALFGDGSGKDADNPLRVTAHKDYDPTAENSKDYLQTLLYQATEVLAETGGTIVICGKVALSDSSIEVNKNKFKTAEFGDKTIKFTSVYNGVDYRKENGAKLLIDTSSGVEVFGNTVWENIDIVTDGMSRSIYFNGYPALIGGGVNCYPRDSAFEGVYSSYISLYGGSYGGKTQGVSTDITVRSGKYGFICGGDYGSVKGTYMENAEINLTLEGTTEVIGAIYGTSRLSNGKFSGNVNITINDGVYGCEIFGVGPAGMENDDGKLIVNINGGYFKDTWCVSVMFETDDDVTLPAYSELNLLGYSSNNYEGLASLYAIVNEFAEGRFTEVLIKYPEVTHPPYCDPNAKDTIEVTCGFDTADGTATIDSTVEEETPRCFGDNLSQGGTSSKAPNENNGTRNIIAVIAVAAAAVVAVTAVIVLSKKETK